jgi:hypothetical protein
MIASYSGASASTVSAVVVAALPTASAAVAAAAITCDPAAAPRRAAGVEVSTVHFHAFDDALVEAALAPARAESLAALLPLCRAPARAGASVAAADFAYGAEPHHGRNDAAASVFGCAGALCVEHPAYAGRISHIDGSLDSLHGLPFALTLQLARDVLGDATFEFPRRDKLPVL